MCDREIRPDRGLLLSFKVLLSLTYTFRACLSSLQMFWDHIFIVVGKETKRRANGFKI